MNLEQIDTSTTAGKAEVMRLAADGRRVAMRSLPGAHPMNAVDVNLYPWAYSAGIHPSWNWAQCDYAIIADPVGPEEVWVVVAGDHLAAGPFKDEQTAIDCSESFRNISNQVVRYIRADLAGEKG